MSKNVVLGMGLSGVAVYDFLKARGECVIGYDDRPDVVQELSTAGRDVAHGVTLSASDRVIVSPGVPPAHPLVVQARAVGAEVVGEVGFALQFLRGRSVGITGTNGKTTVTLLVTHVLRSSGFCAEAVGNVGVPLISYVERSHAASIGVVELSSFQLATASTPILDVGIILNITPNHLDWHTTMEEYISAKLKLKECIRDGGTLWVHYDVFQEFASRFSGVPLTYGSHPRAALWQEGGVVWRDFDQEVQLPSLERGLRGHDLENTIAAWAICREFGVSSEQFSAAVATFIKPPHRLEWVASMGGIDYIDDSKSTNVDATIKAVVSMGRPVVLIVGGIDKGFPYRVWKSHFASVRHVIALGRAADKIGRDLAPEYTVDRVESLEVAVARAREVARAGDVVLLSPGCSSLDMFRDYAHRGREFQRIVKETI